MKLRDYVIESVLGEGGMGRVYAARHARLGERAAVKELLFVDPETAQQFLLEAKVLYGLRHPCFPTVKDYFTAGGRHYLVMDLIEGISMQDVLAVEGRLAVAELQGYILQLLEGLAYLHARQIVHRDVKPGNVVLDRRARRAVLVDFGIARSRAHGSATVAAARAAYTPHMAPPEQYRGEPSTPATDVYQLGATAFYAATGMLPPEGPARLLHDTLPDVRALASDLPEHLGRVIMRAMALEPHARFASAAAMQAEWRAATASASPVTAVSPRALDTYRRQRTLDIRRRG